jgi:hypothetical protein
VGWALPVGTSLDSESDNKVRLIPRREDVWGEEVAPVIRSVLSYPAYLGCVYTPFSVQPLGDQPRPRPLDYTSWRSVPAVGTSYRRSTCQDVAPGAWVCGGVCAGIFGFPLPVYSSAPQTDQTAMQRSEHGEWNNSNRSREDIWGSGGIAPRVLNLGARWTWAISFTSRPLYPRCTYDRWLGGPQSWSGRGQKPCLIRNILLKWITEKYGVRAWIFSCSAGQGPVVGFCERHNETTDTFLTIRGGNVATRHVMNRPGRS